MARGTVETPVHGSATITGSGEGPEIREVLAGVLADVLGVREVGVDRYSFAELGADSLVMARFCARVRKLPDLPPVSMKDVYRHPTIDVLAKALGSAGPAPAPTAPLPAASAPARSSGRQYVRCGALQLLAFLGYSFLVALLSVWGCGWISGGSGAGGVYLRSVLFGAMALLGVCGPPVVAKWVLVGRWKPRPIPVRGLAYVRFWLVRTLPRYSPMVLFAGSPVSCT